MAYEPQSSPDNRLGIHAGKIEETRARRGLSPGGFKEDDDPARVDKEEAEFCMYQRADSHMNSFAPALGGRRAANAAESSEGDEAR